MMMRSALYQTNTLSWIFQCQLIETTVCGQTCRSTRTHYSDSEPTSLCSYSLMPRAQRRSNRYQLYSFQFDPIGARTHDLPHSRRARQPFTLPMNPRSTTGEHANHYTTDEPTIYHRRALTITLPMRFPLNQIINNYINKNEEPHLIANH